MMEIEEPIKTLSREVRTEYFVNEEIIDVNLDEDYLNEQMDYKYFHTNFVSKVNTSK